MKIIYNLKENEEKQKRKNRRTNPRKGMKTAFHCCWANVLLQQ